MAPISWSLAAAKMQARLATELRALGAEAEFIRADVRHEDRPISARLYRWGGSASRMSRMSTQVVLITGGLTGIGRAAA